jgi:hypothetical protein
VTDQFKREAARRLLSAVRAPAGQAQWVACPVSVGLQTAMLPGKPDARAPTRFLRDMVIVYNSESYYVVEYPKQHSFEVVDKCAGRGAYLSGDLAERFRWSIKSVIAVSPSEEDVDKFLGELDALMTQRVAFH